MANMAEEQTYLFYFYFSAIRPWNNDVKREFSREERDERVKKNIVLDEIMEEKRETIGKEWKKTRSLV